MKKIILLFVIILFFFLSLSLAAGPLALFLLKKQLSGIFSASQVSIAGLNFKPLSRLAFSGIEIKKPGAYNFQIGEIAFFYAIARLFKGEVSKVRLSGLSVDINTPQENLEEFAKHLNLSSSGGFFIGEIELSGSRINIRSKNLSLKADAALRFDLEGQNLKEADIYCANFSFLSVSLDAASLKIPPSEGSPNLYIQKISLDKIKIEDIQAALSLKSGSLSVVSLAAEALGGTLKGGGDFYFSTLDYRLDLEAEKINTQDIARDLKMEEKFLISGGLSGALEIKGGKGGVNLLKGNFSLEHPGGRLMVKDKSFLENLARGSQQPLQIIMESLSDYQYNIGRLSLGMEGNDLVFDLSFEGEGGKRDLNIVLHDFKF